MSWKQDRAVIISQMGTTKGGCLRNTRIAASPDIPAKYQTAWEAEQHCILHPGTPPGGVWTPAFFSYYASIGGVYKNWGHVGWHAPDGSFYSDGVRYASIDAYMASHAPKYVGWGESLNDVRVVEWVADPAPSTGQRLYFDPIGQTATFYKVSGGTFAMKIKDASYNWRVLENQGNRVRVNSASAGGDCWVYLKYTSSGNAIPGRYVK